MTRSRIANSIVPIFIATAIVSNMQASQAATPIALVPKPLRPGAHAGRVRAQRRHCYSRRQGRARRGRPSAKLLAERIRRATGFRTAGNALRRHGRLRNAIVLTHEERTPPRSAPKDTRWTRRPSGVTIAAGGGAGLFYGTQTLLQLLPPQIFAPAKVEADVAWTLPAVRIEDKPRFRWRGLLLDVARHFFNKQEIKNFIDLMAEHKLNMLQLHLTDNEGWRIEIKRYPQAHGHERLADRRSVLRARSTRPDKPYGGFFTQDDIREIVAYAKARYVNVVPEIEMPAHAGGALAAYPELSCTGKPLGEFCPGNEATYEFLEGVLTEVLQVFPSKYIHIGGDEASKGHLEEVPEVPGADEAGRA